MDETQAVLDELRAEMVRLRETLESSDEVEESEDEKEPSGDMLTRHPFLCFLLGCLLLGAGATSCSVGKYYDALTAEIGARHHGG